MNVRELPMVLKEKTVLESFIDVKNGKMEVKNKVSS